MVTDGEVRCELAWLNISWGGREFVRRGNPQFTNPAAIEPPLASATSFGRVVEELRFSPSEYLTSPRLRDWVFRNKDQKYVPLRIAESI